MYVNAYSIATIFAQSIIPKLMPSFFLVSTRQFIFFLKIGLFFWVFFFWFPSACATFYAIVNNFAYKNRLPGLSLFFADFAVFFFFAIGILFYIFQRHIWSKFTFLQTHWPCMTPNRANKQRKNRMYRTNE